MWIYDKKDDEYYNLETAFIAKYDSNAGSSSAGFLEVGWGSRTGQQHRKRFNDGQFEFVKQIPVSLAFTVRGEDTILDDTTAGKPVPEQGITTSSSKSTSKSTPTKSLLKTKK